MPATTNTEKYEALEERFLYFARFIFSNFKIPKDQLFETHYKFDGDRYKKIEKPIFYLDDVLQRRIYRFDNDKNQEIWPVVDDFIANKVFLQGSEPLNLFRTAVAQQLLKVIECYIQTENSYNFKERALKKMFGRFYSGWTEKSFEWQVLCPLHGFKADINRIKVGSFAIVKATDAIKEKLWQHSRLGFATETLDNIIELKFVLTKTISGNIDNTESDNNEIKHILSALRIVQSGGVYGNHIYYLPKLRTLSNSTIFIHEFQLPHHLFHEKGYSLSSSSKARLSKIILNLIKCTDNSLALALRRFNLSYSRIHPEDTILDLMICLECLLLFQQNSELQYRLYLNLVGFIGERPVPIKEFIKLAYAIRSKIVHEGGNVSFLLRENKEIKKLAGKAFLNTGEVTPKKIEFELQNLVRLVLEKLLFVISIDGSLEAAYRKLEQNIYEVVASNT